MRGEGRTSFWKELNKPIVLWFLSSVVLAGVSFLYSKHDERERKRTELHATLRLIDAEMAIRFDHMHGVSANEALQAKKLREEVVHTWDGSRGNVIAGYKSMGLYSLASLAQIHADKAQARNIRVASRKLELIWNQLKEGPVPIDQEEKKAYATRMIANIRAAALPRWQLDNLEGTSN